jgi:radical SAM protein with 4Fe4S-binding SPASM domain
VIRIEPASACNLKCSHCPTGVLPMARTIMTPPLFERALEQVAMHVPPIRVAVLYHGGEPFLNKHFLSMVPRVKALGIAHVKAVSNAMLIKPDMCDSIVASGLDAIEFSLDGESPQENDRIRVKCKFDHVSSIIRLMAAANERRGRPLTISIATTQFQTVRDFVPERAAPVPAYLRETFADIENQIEFKSTWAMQWPSLAPSAGYDILRDDSPRKPVTACSLIDDTLTIRANGDVVPCCFDLTSMAVMGNIKTQSLADIWNGSPYQVFRAKFAAGQHPKLCEGCIVVSGDKFLLHKDQDDHGAQRMVPMSSLKAKAGVD